MSVIKAGSYVHVLKHDQPRYIGEYGDVIDVWEEIFMWDLGPSKQIKCRVRLNEGEEFTLPVESLKAIKRPRNKPEKGTTEQRAYTKEFGREYL
ncbi:MAG TPA: hypothetical protein VEA58_04080 [Anaerovoracaceae bacterium]|nr:hypothetical protein [Anaerovoracaceae bacterium]